MSKRKLKKLAKTYACVRQHDATDCGAACLSTIATHYGKKMSLTQIREMAGTDKEGTNAYGMVMAAKKIGFDAKAVEAEEIDAIFGDVPLPAIAHVLNEEDGLHYVVVHELSRERVVIADPDKGVYACSSDEFLAMFKGVLIFLEPTDAFEKGVFTETMFKRFFVHLLPQKGRIISIFLVTLIYTGIGIVSSFYFMFLIDEVLPQHNLDFLAIASIAILGMYVGQSVIGFFRNLIIALFSQKLSRDLLFNFYSHVIKLPIAFFDTRKIGEITSRFQDTSHIQDLLSAVSLGILLDVLMAIGGGIVLFLISPFLFAITVIMIIFKGIIMMKVNRPLREINQNLMRDNEQLNSYMIESLNGIEMIKSFNTEEKVLVETETKLNKLLKSYFRAGMLSNISGSLSSLVNAAGSVGIIWGGFYMAMQGDFSIGQLITFNILSGFFVGPVQSLIGLQGPLQSARVASERLGEVLDLKPEKIDEEEKITPSLNGDINIDFLDFRYGMRDLILRDINISIKSGQRVALVGQSGSGKTTLAKLMVNFYKPERGWISIGEHNINNIKLDHLRNNVAYITQDLLFFSGTIRENLTFGKEEVSFEEIVDICKKTKAHEFIETLPLQYDTKLEENAGNLSVGQRQRLAIARALVSKPEILIMDEATSNLDSISEKAISKQIIESTENMTTIIIAHRLSTIMACDKIFVMDKGAIVEEGSHEELIKQKGMYAALWYEQVPWGTGVADLEILKSFDRSTKSVAMTESPETHAEEEENQSLITKNELFEIDDEL